VGVSCSCMATILLQSSKVTCAAQGSHETHSKHVVCCCACVKQCSQQGLTLQAKHYARVPWCDAFNQLPLDLKQAAAASKQKQKQKQVRHTRTHTHTDVCPAAGCSTTPPFNNLALESRKLHVQLQWLLPCR